MDKPRVFLDSSVLIAAILSPVGGSAYILGNFHSLVSFQIIVIHTGESWVYNSEV